MYNEVQRLGIVKVETQIQKYADQNKYKLEKVINQNTEKLKRVMIDMYGDLYSPDIVYSIWSTSCQNNGFPELVDLYKGKL